MTQPRCDLCAAPLERQGQTEYCSERCLAWAFYGVPALKEDELVREIRKNQQRTTLPSDWQRPMPYPILGEKFQREIIEALALLKDTCNHIRQTDEQS